MTREFKDKFLLYLVGGEVSIFMHKILLVEFLNKNKSKPHLLPSKNIADQPFYFSNYNGKVLCCLM